MHDCSVKKIWLAVLAGVLVVAQAGCGIQKTSESVGKTAEAPAVSVTAAETEETKEVAGPMPQTVDISVAPVPEISEPAEESGFTDQPEEAENQEDEGTLSPPSESVGGSVFGEVQDAEPETDERIQTLLSGLAFPSGNGSWSAYIGDLKAGTEGAVNPQQMQAASLIKLFIMGAVYENYDLLISQYGQGSVDTNLSSMITVSDNDAANTLVSYLGGGDSTAGMNIVNEYCSRNGYSSTHMGRLLLQSNEFDDNYTSVIDCGRFLQKVYEGNKAGDSVSVSEFSLLSAQTRRNKIPAQMPEGVSIANKTGELGDVENDAGIIYNSQNDLIIVFMSQNLTEVGSAQNTIASLSRQIYDYYNS